MYISAYYDVKLQHISAIVAMNLRISFYFAGAIVGFAMSSYKGSEGDTIKVCVTIHSPNETILSMSSVAGRFEISGSAGNSTKHYIRWLFIFFPFS